MGPFDLDGHPDVLTNAPDGRRTVSPFNGSGDWIIAPGQASHWIFEGTGLKAGDRFEGLVGWDFTRPPPIPGLDVIASRKNHHGAVASTFHRNRLSRCKGTGFSMQGRSSVDGMSRRLWAVVPAFTFMGRRRVCRVGKITANFLRKCGWLPKCPGLFTAETQRARRRLNSLAPTAEI